MVACGSSPERDDLPPLFPTPEPPDDTGAVAPAMPEGFLADPETRYFHRMDCPRAESIKPNLRQYYVSPYEALNEGYAPCEYCNPLNGWR